MTKGRLELRTYRVRRWTAFGWSDAADDDVRKDREHHVARAVAVIGARLRANCPRFEPSVSSCRVEHQPQMVFELTLQASSEEDARVRAMYRFERALTAKIPTGNWRGGSPEKVRLAPPWGKVEVDEPVA